MRERRRARTVLPAHHAMIETTRGPLLMGVLSESRYIVGDNREWEVQARIVSPPKVAEIPDGAWCEMYDADGGLIAAFQLRVGRLVLTGLDTLSLTYRQEFHRRQA